MASQTNEALTRAVVPGRSRRRSHLALGGATLAARMSHPAVGAARKKEERQGLQVQAAAALQPGHRAVQGAYDHMFCPACVL